jgi:AAHS family 4-hydroxybenzoate transporter-like MFS transporter
VTAARGRAAGEAPGIDLAAVIDGLPLSALQIRVALLCAAVLFLDAFDSISLGFVAPALSRLWHLPPGALGPVFASGFFGQLLGALIAGPVADKVGRKSVLVAGLVEFGLGALVTTQAHSLQFLLLIRLITGFGLGAALPNAIALTTEVSPRARRSMLLVIVFCGITIGAAAAGVVVARLLPHYGWTSVFWVGGLAPLALAPLLGWGLMESPYLLAVAGGRDAQIGALLRRIDPGTALAPDAHFVVLEERASGLTVRHLFSHGRALATILLWIIVFMNNFEIYVFASWLPSIARASGLTEEASVLTGVALNLGGLAGTLAMGWLLERFSIERMMAVNYAAAAAFLAALAMVAGDRWLMGGCAAGAGFCIVGGQTGANALIAYRHPTYIRSTALAWALGSGRVASIVGPLGAGWVIALGWSSRATFLSAVIPALCASAAVLWLGERVGAPGAEGGLAEASAAAARRSGSRAS